MVEYPLNNVTKEWIDWIKVSFLGRVIESFNPFA